MPGGFSSAIFSQAWGKQGFPQSVGRWGYSQIIIDSLFSNIRCDEGSPLKETPGDENYFVMVGEKIELSRWSFKWGLQHSLWVMVITWSSNNRKLQGCYILIYFIYLIYCEFLLKIQYPLRLYFCSYSLKCVARGKNFLSFLVLKPEPFTGSG